VFEISTLPHHRPHYCYQYDITHHHLKLISTIPCFADPLMHQPTEFQQNRTMHGLIIDDSTNFSSPFFQDGADFYCHFLTYEQNHIKFGGKGGLKWQCIATFCTRRLSKNRWYSGSVCVRAFSLYTSVLYTSVSM